MHILHLVKNKKTLLSNMLYVNKYAPDKLRNFKYKQTRSKIMSVKKTF